MVQNPLTHGAISIHSLHVEGDDIGLHGLVITRVISIHSLHVEGDVCIFTTIL